MKSFYTELPDREDRGINEDYAPIRGILFAAAISTPFWVAVICVAVHFWHKA